MAVVSYFIMGAGHADILHHHLLSRDTPLGHARALNRRACSRKVRAT
jgi:hypothetical protein